MTQKNKIPTKKKRVGKYTSKPIQWPSIFTLEAMLEIQIEKQKIVKYKDFADFLMKEYNCSSLTAYRKVKDILRIDSRKWKIFWIKAARYRVITDALKPLPKHNVVNYYNAIENVDKIEPLSPIERDILNHRREQEERRKQSKEV